MDVATAIALAGLAILLGQGFYFLGKMRRDVDHHDQALRDNKETHETIFRKIDDIWQYVRNGRNPT